MAYGVSLRQREIGVRIALGAQPGQVSRMISRQGLGLALVGVVIGTGVALGATRLLRGLLFDVSPTDPLTFAAACAGLLGMAGLASWLPARRAAAVDPADTLKSA
ncbi:MAG: FtsX-like permease family protein [Gemmatimonadales bacterium]